jgi:predicted TIM-barrel fold metal-dependent hydrolase
MFPDKVIGLASVNPWFYPPKVRELPYSKRGDKIDVVKRYVAMEELERAITVLGLNGLRIHSWAQNCAVNNPVLIFPLMEKLVELQKKLNKKFVIVAHGAGDSLYNSPEAFADLATNFPDLLFVMGHSGFIWAMGTINNLAKVKNILLDITIVTTPHAVMGMVDLMGAEKMTIGSYYPFATPTTKLTLLDDCFQKEEDKELVLGGNIAKRLGIPKMRK